MITTRPGYPRTGSCSPGAAQYHVASLATTPTPTSVTVGTPTAAAPLKDTATLSGGDAPTGTITFTLYNPEELPVDIEHVTVSGNGNYSTPKGYTLPTTGSIAGTYQWDASYSGDADNGSVSDNKDAAEVVTVNPKPGALRRLPRHQPPRRLRLQPPRHLLRRPHRRVHDFNHLRGLRSPPRR